MHFKDSSDGEIHRRLWFCIGVLDLQSAFDRGSQPLIRSEDLTSLPLNLDDFDLSNDRILPKSRINQFTDMSLSLIIYQAGICQRRLTEIGSSFTSSSTVVEIRAARNKQDAELTRFEGTVERVKLLAALSDQALVKFTMAVANECLVAMRLLIHRPLYRCNRPLEAYRIDAEIRVSVLSTATKVLESNRMKRTQHEFAQWAWFA